MWLRSSIAVAVAQASSCSSDLTPSLGTSIWCRFGPKKQKKKEKKKEKEKKLSTQDTQTQKTRLIWLLSATAKLTVRKRLVKGLLLFTKTLQALLRVADERALRGAEMH